MNDWKFIPTIMLATVLIFGAGVFTGGMLVDYVKQPHGRVIKKKFATAVTTNVTAVVAANSISNTPAVKPAKVPEFLSKEFLQRLDADLQLSKDQHEAIKKIIDDGQNAVRKAVQDARLEIREALTTDQRKAFDELVKRPFRRPLFETNLNSLLARPKQFVGEGQANAPAMTTNPPVSSP